MINYLLYKFINNNIYVYVLHKLSNFIFIKKFKYDFNEFHENKKLKFKCIDSLKLNIIEGLLNSNNGNIVI